MSDQKSDQSSRGVVVRVKTAKKRSIASTRWLQRQLNDQYVVQAKRDGYRSRAAYKIIELDEKFGFLKQGKKVIDLGAAPGGWSQYAVKKCGEGNIFAADLLDIPPIPGVHFVQMDFMKDTAPDEIKAIMGRADIVLSDMAPNASGQTNVDHMRIVLLVEAAFMFACEVLNEGGVFVAKVWQGGTENKLLEQIKRHFEVVKHAKPHSSRKDSAETFLVAMGFRK